MRKWVLYPLSLFSTASVTSSSWLLDQLPSRPPYSGVLGYGRNLLREPNGRFLFSVFNRYQSQQPKSDNVRVDMEEDVNGPSQISLMPTTDKTTYLESVIKKSRLNVQNLRDNKWRFELDWLTKAAEPALQLCRWALSTGNGIGNKLPPSSRSLMEIISHIQKSKVGIQDWSLSDLTGGLYLIYLRQASADQFKDVKGAEIFSESIVQDLIYHTELAKGAYKDNAAGLARNSLLRESNVLKFIKNSSVLRPGYYIGVDNRKKLVVFGIRGTHTVYDLITNIMSSSEGEITFEGYSTHFGTAEAARWFLNHETGTIKKLLEKHEGYRLRLVGHSLGGATAALLAIMFREKSSKELGFNPDVVSAIGYATPPCVSRELAESCSEYVTTVVMQDDIIPRLSAASLTRLRNEILETDWMSVLEKEDWRSIVDLVTNAKQVVSTVHDVARKVVRYAKFRSREVPSDVTVTEEPSTVLDTSSTSDPAAENAINRVEEPNAASPEELFVPGTLYYLKRNQDNHNGKRMDNSKSEDYFTLWKRHPGEHFRRIVLSSNMISAHKCDNHYYALRDVLKGLPGTKAETLFTHD